MFYCFYDGKASSYSQKNLFDYAKKRESLIIYDSKEDKFMDSDGKEIDITGKKIYPRTGIYQEIELCEAIKRHGGNSLSSKEDINICTYWPNYYETKRKNKIYSGKELLDDSILKNIQDMYGEKVFFKTVSKNYSEIIPVSYLLDKETVISRCIKNHEADEFMISEPVNILEDEIGKREYRVFVIEGKIVSISRFTNFVFHKIDPTIYENVLDITRKLKNFPPSYVIDVFEYERNGKKEFDVLEFNPLPASGTYLYNSVVGFDSNNILHEDMNLIAQEKRSMLDKIKKLNLKSISYDNTSRVNFDDVHSFAYDLKLIYMFGHTGCYMFDGIRNLEGEQLEMHGCVFDNATLVESEPLVSTSPFQDMKSESIEDCIKKLKANKE